MSTDAKVYAMIDDLSRGACLELLGLPVEFADRSHHGLTMEVRHAYEEGSILSEDIIAAWNDDTWNGKE